MARLEWMAERTIETYPVDVVATLTSPHHVSRVDEVLHDAVHGTLTDAHQSRYLRQPHLAVLHDAHQHMRVVRQERPRRNHRRRRNEFLGQGANLPAHASQSLSSSIWSTSHGLICILVEEAGTFVVNVVTYIQLESIEQSRQQVGRGHRGVSPTAL